MNFNIDDLEDETAQIDVTNYIKDIKSIDEEMQKFKKCIDSPTYEKAQVVLHAEILLRSAKKQKDLSTLMGWIFSHIEKELSYKNSVYILRLLRATAATRLYTPSVYYIVRIIDEAESTGGTARKTEKTGKFYGFEKTLRLSSDDLKSAELQLFVIGEALLQLRAFLKQFGSSIGFPELSSVICGELKKKCKKGEYKEEIESLIKAVTKRREYISKERSSKNVDIGNGKVVSEFERGLEAWVF